MKDYLTYVNDMAQFREEIKKINSQYININERGNASLTITKGIVIYNKNQSMSICRCKTKECEEFLKSLPILKIIGIDDHLSNKYKFYDGKEIYERFFSDSKYSEKYINEKFSTFA